jgi:hypothetical protein
VNVARVGLVPHSNHAFVARPFGFTLPFSTAPLAVTPVAAVVVTVGGGAVAPYKARTCEALSPEL